MFNAAGVASELGEASLDLPKLLLCAYERWGFEFPRYVEGEFVIVLWDRVRRRLLLVRDTTGSQPLYYSRHGEDFLFSSEIRPLVEWAGGIMRPDENHVAHWLATVPSGDGSTFFANVQSVPPGHTLLFEDGRLVVQAFWHPGKRPLLQLKDCREYEDGLREVLCTAIKDRLPSSGSVGSHLSGGLDSASVSALTAGLLQRQGRRLRAFTAVPEFPASAPGRFCDEGPHAALVASMYPNIDHVRVRHGSLSTFSLMDAFSSTEERPILNPSNYDWMYDICRQAQAWGIETILSGAMGNFTISYDGVDALAGLVKQSRFREAADLAQAFHGEGGYRWLAIAHLLIRPLLPLRARHFVDRLRAGGGGVARKDSLMRPEFARSQGLDAMARERYSHGADIQALRLAALSRVDQGPSIQAMFQLTGVCSTDPTMDRRVVEYCLSVPLERYCDGGVPRSLLRNAMAGLLPEAVRTERKKGLQAADFAEHFRAERQEALREVARLREVDLVARALDLEAMESMLQWTDARIASEGWTSGYWAKLLRALSLGRFLRRMEDGSLFTQAVRDLHAAEVHD